MSRHSPPPLPVAADRLSVGIVAARFNPALIDPLLRTVQARLLAAGVRPRRLRVVRVPGSHELPVAALWLAASGRCDCVVALGVLIKGGTAHHRIVGQAVTDALQRVALATRVPVVNGVLVVETPAQAAARCRGRLNRGTEFAGAALEMAALRRTAGRRA